MSLQQPTPSAGSEKKIVVVDDDVYVRQLLQQLLEDFKASGVKLFYAQNGIAAWELIQTEKPDLILLDLMLPGISGYELCRRIRSDRALAAIHIIVLTARGQSADETKGLKLGADEYVTKPFNNQHLIQLIGTALQVEV